MSPLVNFMSLIRFPLNISQTNRVVVPSCKVKANVLERLGSLFTSVLFAKTIAGLLCSAFAKAVYAKLKLAIPRISMTIADIKKSRFLAVWNAK
jgi:hypothetical protein